MKKSLLTLLVLVLCFLSVSFFTACAANEAGGASPQENAAGRNLEREARGGIDISQRELSVFAKDTAGDGLGGASFNLYVATLPDFSAPPDLTTPLPVLGTDGTSRNFYLLLEDITTDASGAAVLSHPWFEAADELLFLLVEREAPSGYTWLSQNTFFVINAGRAPRLADENAIIFGQEIHQISDSIVITNIPEGLDPVTLRVLTRFYGLVEEEVSQLLPDFQLVITDPLGDQHTFGIEEVLDPLGIAMADVAPGTYFITELNSDVPGYTW